MGGEIEFNVKRGQPNSNSPSHDGQVDQDPSALQARYEQLFPILRFLVLETQTQYDSVEAEAERMQYFPDDRFAVPQQQPSMLLSFQGGSQLHWSFRLPLQFAQIKCQFSTDRRTLDTFNGLAFTIWALLSVSFPGLFHEVDDVRYDGSSREYDHRSPVYQSSAEDARARYSLALQRRQAVVNGLRVHLGDDLPSIVLVLTGFPPM